LRLTGRDIAIASGSAEVNSAELAAAAEAENLPRPEGPEQAGRLR
jgi:hypothetical protein